MTCIRAAGLPMIVGRRRALPLGLLLPVQVDETQHRLRGGRFAASQGHD
jgi:hypothetical protein